jgi:hypothetical protein
MTEDATEFLRRTAGEICRTNRNSTVSTSQHEFGDRLVILYCINVEFITCLFRSFHAL